MAASTVSIERVFRFRQSSLKETVSARGPAVALGRSLGDAIVTGARASRMLAKRHWKVRSMPIFRVGVNGEKALQSQLRQGLAPLFDSALLHGQS